MAKIMLFIDGTWLYANNARLAESYGRPNYQLDYGKLPRVLAEAVGYQLGTSDVDVVRTYLFGSYAENCDPKDDEAVARRLDFFSMLKEEFHYEVELFPIDFKGRRLRKADRQPGDPFEPREKCVDISLATSMLYLAAIPFVYDVAIAVIGDQDFKPVLQHVRRLGKRVAIASIKGSCAPEFSDPRDAARVKDFDIIWIDDLLNQLELKRESHRLECQSCHKQVWTEFYPRKGQKFYCDSCREAFARQREEAQQFIAPQVESAESGGVSRVGHEVVGLVRKKIADKACLFIRTSEGHEYYLHVADLEGLELDQVQEGTHRIAGIVKRDPAGGKAGAIHKARVLLD